MENQNQKNQNNQPTPKLVKIKTLRPIMVNRVLDKQGILNGEIIPEGREIEVSPEDAVMFCDTIFEGFHSYQGERFNDKTRHENRRAVRV